MLLLHWAQGHGACLTHLSTAHDTLPYPHPWSDSTFWAIWECALWALGSDAAASSSRTGGSRWGRCLLEGQKQAWRSAACCWWWFRLAPGHSWNNVGPVTGDTSAGSGAAREGSATASAAAFRRLQLGRCWGSGCSSMPWLSWLLSPKPSLMSSSVSHIKGLRVFPLLFTCIISDESLQHLGAEQNSVNVAESSFLD